MKEISLLISECLLDHSFLNFLFLLGVLYRFGV